ncbi:BlaR1 family beta-lactam sensor/signal transducer [Alkalicoccobacillus gibsonii]|uniref:BlaR1 family beta-lactam sensor/signal transducer n=1 Tax=Alkalicoccobacillus gibsonii TaxID=79881 RepID=A0ABU9VN63_9BACI
MFLSHFIIGLCVSSFSITVILFLRNRFGRQLNAKGNYYLWMFLLVMLLFPFIPTHVYYVGSFLNDGSVIDRNILHSNGELSGIDAKRGLDVIQDFSVSVNRLDLSFIGTLIFVIWSIGAILFSVHIIRGLGTLRRIKKRSSAFTNQDILSIFEDCKERLMINKSINVISSNRIYSPMIFGLFRTYIALPSKHEHWISPKQYEYIFLHELNHYKNKDLITNYVIVFFQIVYWFNPLVWIAFKEMRLDREIACDASVLNLLDDHLLIDYGNTIINFVDSTKQNKKLHMVSQIYGSKNQLKKRIQQISAFKSSLNRTKSKQVFIYLLTGIILFVQIPIVSAFSSENSRYDFDYGSATIEDFQGQFKGYEGSFVLYDKNAKRYHIYNEEKSMLRVSPNSTYKIFSALFALDLNVISTDHSTLPWDGSEQPYTAWSMDQDVSSAIQRSVNWYFTELDYRMGLESIQSNLKNIHYGNTDVSGGLGGYWLESSLKISPIEQVQLLRAFYENQFGFKESHINLIKDSLLLERSHSAQLSGKTGTGSVNGHDTNGWFIGYVETENNTYFFATNLQSEDHASGSTASEITLKILKDLRIYEEN